MRTAARCALAGVLALAAVPAAHAKIENLLPNGGFEKGLEGWKVENESGTFKAEIDGKVRAEGKSSARLTSTVSGGFANDRLTFDLRRLPPGKRVVVSARVQGKDLRNAFLKLFVFDAKDRVLVEDVDVAKYTGSFDWRDADRKFDLPKEAVRAEVRFCLFLGGEAWLDDVRVMGDAAAAREFVPSGGFPGEEPGGDGGAKSAAGEEDGIRTEDLRAGRDERKRYLLHGPRRGAKEPRDGWRIAVVMPGGSGTAEFAPFVRNILRNGLSDDYLVAQPVAFKWTGKQEIVWPTKGSPVEGMQFTTEEFVDAVVEELAAGRKVDRTCVFTLSWSSSGPAAYAIALREKSPVTGSYVAMSVFVPDRLPPLENGKGRAFILDHSPDDRVCRFSFAEKARDELRKAGARIELSTYEGGHGWHGDVFGRIRRGFEFLERSRPKK